ncbi:MAG: hypothetical protein Q7S95_03495 [bacterium]|nr:hypothetical protein [bacterium]
MTTLRSLFRAQSRGFISLGLILLLVIGLAALGGAGWWATRSTVISGTDANPTSVSTTPITTSTSSETQYLLFQYNSGSLFKEDPNSMGTPFDSADVGRYMDSIPLGNNHGDGKTTQLGFTVGPLSLDQTDAEMRTVIQQSFKLAEDKNLAVAFHIDDSMFWIKRKDLWSDPKNVEWSDWSGTANKQRFVEWASKTTLAPQMCYNSTAIKTEVGRIAKDVIGAEIKKGVDHLNTIGKLYLFAGVIADWEPMLMDNRFLPPESPLPHVRLGYCALTNLGYSASNPPADYDVALEGVVHDFLELWAKKLNEGGVSTDRIYTHIFASYVPKDQIQPAINALSKACNCKATLLTPYHVKFSTAFNAYSRPGFSTYAGGFLENGVDVRIAPILQELPKHGSPHWASSEGFNLDPGTQKTELTWDKYLGDMFNNGATIVNLFPVGPNTDEAIQAYKKFLSGVPL